MATAGDPSLIVVPDPAPGVRVWKHTFAQGEPELAGALAFREWAADAKSLDALRGVLVATAGMIAKFEKTPGKVTATGLEVPAVAQVTHPFSIALFNTVGVLEKRLRASNPKLNLSPTTFSFETGTTSGAVSAVPIPVVIAITAGVTAAIAVVSYFGRDVIDRDLARSEETKRMMIRHQQALSMLAPKGPESRIADLTPDEKKLFEALLNDQRAAAAKTEAPLGGGESTGLVLAAAAAAAIYLLT